MSQPFLAQIIWVGFDFAPRGWALCDGQILPINQNQSLYSLLGTTYGGDGRTSFALPDLRGRAMIQSGQGAGLPNITLGQKFGAEQVTLTTAELPAHTHTATLHAEDVDGPNNTPAGNLLGHTGTDTIYAAPDPNDNVLMADDSVIVDAAGAGQSVFNRDPFQGINAIIALTGVFPSRN